MMRWYDWIVIFGIILIGMVVTFFALRAIPVHAQSLSVSGDVYSNWTIKALGAQAAFTRMGNPGGHLVKPSKEVLLDSLKGVDALYIIAHGYYQQIYINRQPITADEIDAMGELDFLFMATCDSMCDTGRTFKDAAKEVVGYCHMFSEECRSCWYGYSTLWQEDLFNQMQTQSVEASFNHANAAYPQCSSCVRYHKNVEDKPVNIQPIINYLLRDHV